MSESKKVMDELNEELDQLRNLIQAQNARMSQLNGEIVGLMAALADARRAAQALQVKDE